MSAKLTFSLLFAVLAVGLGANIFDYFNFEDKTLIEAAEVRNDQLNRNCMCKGPACVCCVDFNITVVDLGGPGCVHMKYVSPEEGFAVRVSYGKNLIHSSKIKGTNPPPVCLDIFGWVAQVCAKFDELAPTSDGLRGCLELQPKLMHQTQIEFPIGCFKSTPGGMEMEDPPKEVETTENPETEKDEETDKDDEKDSFDAESFLLGVYQTAEQGVSFLSSLLDIPRNRTKPVTTPKPESEESESEDSQRRASKKLKHPNQL